jgi:hypothetical protein
MIDPKDLASELDPTNTILFLGAGASAPSGGPLGEALARRLCRILAKDESLSSDLMEACSILEDRYTRPKLIEVIREELRNLRPTGGLLALPEFEWRFIYTTNFDELVEAAYGATVKPITPIRSDFDYHKAETATGQILFKIHGCVREDIVDGHRARMVLTERDYEAYRQYREMVFKSLELHMLSRDVLVIGHSLRDTHLRNIIYDVAAIKERIHASTRVYALIYQADTDRARLLEQRGIVVAFGDLDRFLQNLASNQPPTKLVWEDSGSALNLPPRLRPVTIDVSHSMGLNPDVHRLFNGSAASYADIARGLTFERSAEPHLLELLTADGVDPKLFLTITGTAGVGKTTLARRLVVKLQQAGWIGWEHRGDSVLASNQWLAVEQRLREQNRHGVLLIDECLDNLGYINELAEDLGKLETSNLRCILTANNARWVPRTKSVQLFAKGHVERLSQLTETELGNLTNLVETQNHIRDLVDQRFAKLNRLERLEHLRGRCSSDMYVCLKNIFATDALDAILLREYADMQNDLQDIYRYVSALEAAGARVHRQLVIKMVLLPPDAVGPVLQMLDGIVDEYDISPRDGLYGWATRHPVIAQTIAHYKFADQGELLALFNRIIDQLNPAIWLELKTMRNMCDLEFGIGRLSSNNERINLYRRLVKLAPGERVPRHRLISKLIYMGELDEAAREIRHAEEALGIDSPVNRYKVRLAVRRSASIEGLMVSDRVAILLDAERIALEGIRKFPIDKYSYFAYGEVAESLARSHGRREMLEKAIAQMRKGVELVLDPQLSAELDRLEKLMTRPN